MKTDLDALELVREAVKARHLAATPGPYRWEVDAIGKLVQMTGASAGWGRRTILQPVRWGMNRAAFLLLDQTTDLLNRVDEYFRPVPGHEHHPWMKLIDHPDAIALEHSWQDVEDLLNAAESLIGELKLARKVVEAAEIIAEYQPFDVDHGKLGNALDAALAAYQTATKEGKP